MIQRYFDKIMRLSCFGKRQQSNLEMFLITGDVQVQMSDNDIATIGIIFKIKNVLRDTNIGIYNKFKETNFEIKAIKEDMEETQRIKTV